MASNKCLTTWLDWSTASGHFDARAIRNCSLTSHNYGVGTTDVSTPRTFNTGMQKWAVCYGTNNSATQSCTLGPLSVCPFTYSHSFSSTNKTVRSWVRSSSSQYFYFSGGDFWESGS